MSDRILLGTRKGLFQIEKGARGWAIARASFLADNVSLTLHDRRDGMHYAALDHGHFGVKMQRSKDGMSWEECGVPQYPAQKEGEEEKDHFGKVMPWKLIRIWALEPGLADQPGVLWCGTIPGGLFQSRDQGTSWSLVESLWYHPDRKKWFGGGADYPGIHSVCVHPKDGKHVAIGVSCGGVWITTDGGSTWDCRATGMRAEYMPPEQQFNPVIQDDHRLVQCAASPDAYWAQHHNGIFRTTDGCANWQELKDVKPSAFGFAVAVHPAQPDTAWFVPAIKDEKRIPVDGKVVVTRTRDGGKTFETLSKGLPQEHAYDLVYRHAFDIDGTGDCLAMGSTTGNFWISEDQGDTWQTISHHLPPIYSVRFA